MRLAKISVLNYQELIVVRTAQFCASIFHQTINIILHLEYVKDLMVYESANLENQDMKIVLSTKILLINLIKSITL